jgi:hypothetical protein
MTTVVDALVVTLGLDPSNFKKGTEQAEKSLGETADATKKASGIITQSLQDVGKQVAILFLGFESAVGFLKMLGGLNQASADLGRTAANLGISAHELNRWGLAVELAGGDAKDAYGAFQLLSQALTNRALTGEVSPLLNILQKYGVAITDQNGKLKDTGQIYNDLADRLSGFSRQQRHNILAMAGLSEGMINFLVLEKDKRAQLTAEAERANAVTKQSVEEAQELQKQWREVGQAEKGALQTFLADITPSLLAGWRSILDFMEDVFIPQTQELGDRLGALFAGDFKAAFEGGIKGLLHTLATGGGLYAVLRALLRGLGIDIVPIIDSLIGPAGPVAAPKGAGQYLSRLNAAETKYGIPANLLAQIAHEESGFRPDIISGRVRSKTGAVGLMQLQPQFFPGAGKNVDSDIDTAAAYLASLYKQFGTWRLAIAAYNAGPETIKKVIAGQRTLSAETRNYLRDVYGSLGPNPDALAAGRGITPTPSVARGNIDRGGSIHNSTSTVQIDQITVHTQATDAEGIAATLPGALERKGVVNQADTGLVP